MRIHACAKTYGGRTVLRFPGLTLAPGTICAVVGANGSGKSTLARLTAGAIRPDGDGPALESPCQVGYMPQKSFAFRLTVRQNLLLPGGDPARAEALMEALGLTSLAGRRADRLSGGETARMALARVLMRPWELLVLDEPLNAIDIKSVSYFRKLFRELNEKEGVTIILTSHYSQDIQELCRHTYDIHLLRAGL